jgi:hypothetical protein
MGRLTTATEVRALIRRMAAVNPHWGAPRIHGELQKLGISVSQATVAKSMPRRNKPPSQPWRTFLATRTSGQSDAGIDGAYKRKDQCAQGSGRTGRWSPAAILVQSDSARRQ